MKRKVFSSLLLLVTMVAAGSMLFVSCKDYDDDINDLQNQITANATDLTSLVSEKVNNASVEIADLQAQAAALQAAYEAADQALQATMQASIDNAYASATGYADALSSTANSYTDAQTAAANAYAEVQAAAAQAAAIAAAQESVEAAASTLQSALSAATSTLEAQGISIDGINSSLTSQGNSISDLQANVTALLSADATLTEGISAAQARADEAYSLAQSALDLAETNKTNLENLQSTVNANITALQTQIESAQSQIDGVSANLSSNTSDLQSQIDALNALITSLGGEVAESVSSTVSSLQDQITTVNGLITEKQTQIDDLKDLLNSCNDAVTANSNSITDINTTVYGLQITINTFDSQISVLQSSVQNALDLANSNYASITSLTSQLSSLSSSNEAMRYALVTQLKDYVENLQSQITSNGTSISQNATDITKINEILETLQKSLASCESEISANSDAISTNTGKIATNTADIEANAAAILSLSNDLSELKGVVSSLSGVSGEYLESLMNVYGGMQDLVATSQASILKALGDSVTSLTKYIDTQVSATNKNVTELQTSLEARLSALESSVGDVEDVQGAIDAAVIVANTYTETYAYLVAVELNERIIEAQNNAVEIANVSIVELRELYNNMYTDLQSQITEIVNVYLAKIQEKIEAVCSDIEANTNITAILLEYAKSKDLEDVQTVLNQLMIALDLNGESLGDVSGSILSDYVTSDIVMSMINTSIEGYVTIDQLRSDYLSGYVTSAELEEVISNMNSSSVSMFITLEKLQTIINSNSDAIDALQALNVENNTYIGNVEGLVTDLQAAFIAEVQRLKSMVYIPKSYVGGIACIDFVTLQYTSWKSAYADSNTGNNKGDTYSIDDENHTEEYFVNPTNASIDPENLSFVSNSATTRVSNSAPISIVDGSVSVKDGVLSMNITKDNVKNSTLGDDDANPITIVSLKAVITDEDLLTDEEKEAGTEVAVYSDWARLCETTVTTPHIHNTDFVSNGKATGCNINNNIVNRSVKDGADFWSYSYIYGKQTSTNFDREKTTVSSDYVDACLAKSVLYTDAIDLHDLVVVADENKKTYTTAEIADYGLEFKFILVDYYMLEDDQGYVTNQQSFASLDDDGVLTSKSAGDYTNNAAAVGKQPVIQVQLIDTKNGNQIVDVAYFKIKWTPEDEEPENSYYTPGITFENADFECGVEIYAKLPSMTLESLYEFSDDYKSDMSMTTFHSTYSLCQYLFASQKDAEENEGTSKALTALGTLDDVDNDADGQTHNILWTIDLSELQSATGSAYNNYKITKADYENGYKTITAYAYYEKSNGSRLIFPVTLTLNINQISQSDYNQKIGVYWSADGTTTNISCDVNAVRGQTTTISGSLNAVWGNGSAAAQTIDDLITTQDPGNTYLKWVFTSAPSGYEFRNNDYTTLYLKGETNPAATIEADGTISLYEDESGVPSEGALGLVGSTVSVRLQVTYCSLDPTYYDDAIVYFIEPLTVSVNESLNSLEIYDLASDPTAEVAGSVTLRENNGTYGGIVWTDDESIDAAEVVAGLSDWYGVEGVDYDLTNAVVSYTGYSGSLDGCSYLFTLGWLNDDPTTKTLVYTKTEGTNGFTEDITIRIPITVTSKWQVISDPDKYYITVTIKQGEGLKTVKRK